MNAKSIADSQLPGADLVSKGLDDLFRQQVTVESLLVLIAGPNLRRLGIELPDTVPVAKPYEHALYTLLEETHLADAHSQYNALIRRLVSFERTLEREVSAARKSAQSHRSD